MSERKESMTIKNEVKYIISTYPSKFAGYQSKKGRKGIIKAYISTI